MKLRDRIAFLTDWSLRDERMGLGQARLDEAKAPGILQAVEYQIALHEEFARTGSDWQRILGEMIPLPQPTTRGKR